MSAREHLLHGTLDRSVAADIKFDDLDAILSQRLRMIAVLRLRIAHRREHRVAGAGQRLGSVAAEAAAGACDQDCLGHDWFLSLVTVGASRCFPRETWARRCGLVSAD